MQTEEIRRLFARRVRETRLSRGLSQEQVAAALTERGVLVEATAVVRLEQAKRKVGVEEAAALADILDVTLNDLLAPEVPPLVQRQAEATASAERLGVEADALQAKAELARAYAEQAQHEAEYLQLLIDYQRHGRRGDLLQAIAAGCYLDRVGEDQLNADLAAAGVPLDVVTAARAAAEESFATATREEGERALDVLFRLFAGHVLAGVSKDGE